jgi:CxxC-x17-CxxC domain-containing protein
MKKSSKTSVRKAKPDFAGFMAKIQEQMDVLEKKIDAFVGQWLSRPEEVKDKPAPAQPAAVSPQNGHGNTPRQSQGGRVMYQAVCAECQQECEVPFKPSGDRPVYCQPCFTKRKSGGKGKNRGHSAQGAAHGTGAGHLRSSAGEQRHVVVTKKGVGKVTVSDIVRPHGAHPQSSSKAQEHPRKMRHHFPKRKSDGRGPKPSR